MNKLREVRPAHFPLRLRLTLWYLLTLTLILLLSPPSSTGRSNAAW